MRKFEKITFENVEAEDVFESDNNGFKHGLYWFNENNEIIDCQWFKSTKERIKFKKDFHN